jgi:hypothetical protein
VIPTADQTLIGTVRVFTQPCDELRLRLNLTAALSELRLPPTTLPPQSILLVRRLVDSHPRYLNLGARDFAASSAWCQALNDQLDNFARRAHRLAAGAAPLDAEAVLFADKAEMLACLARDWLSGSLWTRWWWKSLLRTGYTSAGVKQLWRDHPQYVPAALDQLERQDKAASFVSALTDSECHEILRQVLSVFAMRETVSVCETPIVIGVKTDGEVVSYSPSRVTAGVSMPELAPGPWVPWCSETTSPDLSPEQQRFRGIALMIQGAPAQARSRTFAQALERWQEAVARRVHDERDGVKTIAFAPVEEHVESHPESSIDPGIVSTIQPAQHTARKHKEVADAQPAAIHDAEARQSQIESWHEESSVTVAASDLPLYDSVETEVRLPISDPVPGITEALEGEPEVSDLTQPDLVTSVSDDDRVEVTSVEIETQLGGLFYLINLALYLNLYGDFTMPAAPGIELNIWDFVALVGAELARDAPEEDPIWSLLADLAGRDQEEPPGSSFAPDDEWRLPPEWLSIFIDDRPWRWSAGRERLRVLHPEGFVILDLPPAKDAREQLQSEIKRYDVSESSLSRGGVPKLSPLRTKVTASPKVRRWLSLLMPYVHARLSLALGLKSQKEIATALCQRYARVRATDTHIDVFFTLADLPLEIRFAGLDRDPGWVPAAGRFITFHFD